MGAWGSESCSNDSCWDALKADDIHNMTQKEADLTLEKCFVGKIFRSTRDKQTGLGVVIWILRLGLKVDKKFLKRASEFAKSLAEDEEYLSEWKSVTTRKDNLAKELDDIKYALSNDGCGVERHIPGLFERLSRMGNEN